MRRARIPLLLAVVAFTLADVLAALALNPGRRPVADLSPRILLAVWLALGGRPVAAPGRLLGTWLMVAFWSLLFRSTVPPGDAWRLISTMWGMVLVTQAAVVAGPLLIARLSGCVLADEPSPAVRKGDRKPAFQFTLGSLLVWTAVVAFCLGTSTLVFDFDRADEIAVRHLLTMVVVGAGHGLIALAVVWAVLGRRWLPVRVLLAGLVIGGVVAAYAKAPGTVWLLGQAWGDWRRFLTLALLGALVLLVALVAVRLSGLRIVRRPRRSAESG